MSKDYQGWRHPSKSPWIPSDTAPMDDRVEWMKQMSQIQSALRPRPVPHQQPGNFPDLVDISRSLQEFLQGQREGLHVKFMGLGPLDEPPGYPQSCLHCGEPLGVGYRFEVLDQITECLYRLTLCGTLEFCENRKAAQEFKDSVK